MSTERWESVNLDVGGDVDVSAQNSPIGDAGASDDSYSEDEINRVLDILNLKIVERRPQDENCLGREFFSPLNSIFNIPVPKGHTKDGNNLADEVQKWKNFSQILERRTAEAELKADKLEQKIIAGQRWKPLAKASGKKVSELQKKIREYEKKVKALQRKKLEQNFEKERETWHQEKERLLKKIDNQQTTINKVYQEKGTLLVQSEIHRKAHRELQSEVTELKQKKKRMEGELNDKVYYSKQVERIMEQQQQVLRTSKEKHKKVKEEMQETILSLELSVAGKEDEIERLKEEVKASRKKM